MILANLFNILLSSIEVVLSLLPNLPSLPDNLLTGAYSFIDLIFDNVGLLGLFIPIPTIKVVVPLLLLIINFDKIYKLTLWVLNKIPKLDID